MGELRIVERTVRPPTSGAPTSDPSSAVSPASALIAALAASEDPVLGYKASLLREVGPGAAPRLEALRARIPESPMARALLRGRDTPVLHAYRKWQGPHWTLTCLALIDYPPGDDSLRPLIRLIDEWLFSRQHLSPPGTIVYTGQENRVRRCGSQEGNAIWYSVRLGLENDRTIELVDRLVGWQWPDGGWNCDRRRDARSSSFQETAIPARGLWAFGQRHGYEPAIRAAHRAAELMLSRRLLWRRGDGSLIEPYWGGAVDRIHFPIQFYDVLFAPQVMAELGRIGDPRCADALALLESKRLRDGGFPAEDLNAAPADGVVSRGSFARWGPSGTRRGNPLVSLAALGVLQEAERARAVPGGD
ncbi:MAG: hypothetical protein ABSD62_04450 [Candidatus Limnocylindrales bacterium]|jgi:hypothetical protein